MKVFIVVVVALMALAAVQADCGCLKCSKNLYVASPPSAPVQVIYRGATCSCNRQLPYKVEQPIVQSRPVTLRDHAYSCMPLRIVKKVVQAPLYSYDSMVQVPVEQQRCNKCLVGLVAQPDRVVLPAPSCRQPASAVPSRGPVFEALSSVDDEADYVYQYPVKKCSCGRYFKHNKFDKNVPRLGSRFHDGYRDLTQQEVDDNVSKNIKDIFFEDTLPGRVRRLFCYLQSMKEPVYNVTAPLGLGLGLDLDLGLGRIKFGPPPEKSSEILSRSERSSKSRPKRALWPFLAPQRSASTASAQPQGQASAESVEARDRGKRSMDALNFTFDEEDEDNHIPHGHDESYEEYHSMVDQEAPGTPEDMVSLSLPTARTSLASSLLVDTLQLDQLLPQIPLLFFVNAPISMLAHFHRLNKHFEPVVMSVPTVIRTSGKYFSDFGEKFKRSFIVFTSGLMSSFDDLGRRMKRSSPLERFEVVKCKIHQDGSVDFVLFNHSARKLKDIALVIENFTLEATEAEDVKMYLAKVDTTSLKEHSGSRSKRDIFEVDLNGDIQDLIKEKWGHLMDEAQEAGNRIQSAEAIFEDHFNQVPKLYDALHQHHSKGPEKTKKKKTSKMRSDPILGSVHGSHSAKKKHEDFGDLHPEKNLDIIKGEISTVLGRLQSLLHADVEADLKFYEDLVKLQYLKNTLVMDWRKHLTGDQGQVVSAKMNILNYIKELEKFRASLTRKLLILLMSKPAQSTQSVGDAYNRSDLIKFLVELYKLQMIFTRIHEDLNDKIRLGSRFNHNNEDTFIRQLERIQFVEKTNKFELEHRLKAMRDSQVEQNMNFLERLRKLSELDESVEMEHDDREEVHHVARMIKENAHYKQQQLKQVKEISAKVKLHQTYRKELKNLWDLEKHILENDQHLMKTASKEREEPSAEVQSIEENVSKEEESDSLEKFDILKMATPITLKPLELKDLKELAEFKPNLNWEKDIKVKMDDFVKDMENKRKAWVKKTKKLAEIMKEP